jgi:hypothetical protein
MSSGGGCFTIDICPDILIAAIAAAAAGAFFFLYEAITMAGRRRRRKRHSRQFDNASIVFDLVASGNFNQVILSAYNYSPGNTNGAFK